MVSSLKWIGLCGCPPDLVESGPFSTCPPDRMPRGRPQEPTPHIHATPAPTRGCVSTPTKPTPERPLLPRRAIAHSFPNEPGCVSLHILPKAGGTYGCGA